MDTKEFINLFTIVKKLRDPVGGCPWDLEQTHKTLLKYLVEESFEYIDAVEKNNSNEMKDELGDVLLQVLLHSVIAEQNSSFNFQDVCKNLSEKLVRRHPHVFGEAGKLTSSEVTENWQKIKNQEKGNKKKYFINSRDTMNTALNSANKIGVKSREVNFDWIKYEDVLSKVDEELDEVKEAINLKDKKKIEEELGDLLFSVAQLTRHLDLDPESVLKKANLKFVKRFNKLEDYIDQEKLDIKNISNDKMEVFWEKVKKNET